MMKLIMFGPPGAGKGTQADILGRRYGIKKISTGDALRDVIRSGSELGEQVKDLMDQGKFVPDEIVTEIIRDRVSSPDCANGFHPGWVPPEPGPGRGAGGYGHQGE